MSLGTHELGAFEIGTAPSPFAPAVSPPPAPPPPAPAPDPAERTYVFRPMTATLVTRLPTPPSRRNPKDFNTRADAFNDALLTFCDQINQATPGDSAAGLAQYLAQTGDGKGGNLVRFAPTLPGGNPRTLQEKAAESISVVDLMTDAERADWYSGAPTMDHTAAINRATTAAAAFTDNANAPKRTIRMPAGNWNIAGPVYVRKGQTLRGDGIGATRVLQNPAATGSVFVLGSGIAGASEAADPGGLPPQLSELHIHSASASAPAVRTSAAGALLNDLFITNAGLGISVDGAGDVMISRCFFDQGLSGISLSNCQNVIISDCLFYLQNYDITFGSRCFDVQINGCHFEYTRYTSVLFSDGAANISNIAIGGCQFLLNEQHSTFLGFIHLRSGGVDASINHCQFRNSKGYAITHGSGIGGDLSITNCLFDGARTNPLYTQSTSAAGIGVANKRVRIRACEFRNLAEFAVTVTGTASSTVDIEGGNYSGISAPSAINLAASLGSVRIHGVKGDNVTPLVNAQSAMAVKIKGCIDWLGAMSTSGARYWWKIPFTAGPMMATVTASANTNPTGDARYSRSGIFVVSKFTTFNASVKDTVRVATVTADPGDAFGGAITLFADIGTVLGGSEAAASSTGGYVVISMSTLYSNPSVSVDFN